MANPVEMQTVSERMRQLLHFTGENFYGGIQWPENWPQLVAKEKYMFFPATPFVYEIPRFGETIRAGVQGGHPPTNAIIKNAFVPNLAANSEPYLVTYNAGTDTLRIEKR